MVYLGEKDQSSTALIETILQCLKGRLRTAMTAVDMQTRINKVDHL